MKKNLLIVLSLLMVASFVLAACGGGGAATPAPAQTESEAADDGGVMVEAEAARADRVQIYWYIGLGAGAQAQQIPLEREWVDKFNASQDHIQLIMIVVDNKFARDNLTAQIAAGNAPDIVGPVGTEGRGFFPGAFLDLQPLVDQFNYDTSDIDPAFLEFYKDQGELVGLPFAIFPSAVLLQPRAV